MPGLWIPDLGDPYAQALQDCLNLAFERYDVVSALVAGTIVRGTPDVRSDLDVHLLHRGSFRERRQELHRGVACEMFVNPPSRIERYFEEDRPDRRPMTAHMFATGVLVYDPDGIGATLQERARGELLNPPAPDPKQLEMARYSAATMLEDALDLAVRDRDGALLILGSAVWSLAACRVGAEPGWLPRPKDLFARLQTVDSEAARLVATANGSGSFEERMAAGQTLCVSVTGSEGFFEWVSEREEY
jgi:hypothetical protein